MGSRKRSDWTGSSWAGFADWVRRLELRGGAIRGLLAQRGSGEECCWDSGGDRCGGDGGVQIAINRRINTTVTE